MGRYRLVNKTAKEVVDVQDNLTDMEEAKEYFYFKKQIPSKDDFERLYEVKSENDREENKNRD
tara:strand:- start:166 stop:354 length:189 start_codon:yes stop_codon:yes gene_type:complete